MWARFKQRLGTLGQVGVWTVVGGIALNIALEILPYTGYYVSQRTARVLFWASVATLLLGIAFITIALAKHRQRQSEEKTQTESEYDHNAHVAKLITDSKAEALLKLPDALQALGELDIELAYQLGKKKRSKAILVKIQTRLQKDWELKPSETTYRNLNEQTIRDEVNQAITRMNLSDDVNEDTMIFMLHLAGVLDDEGVGISIQRERNNRYKAVARLQAKIATQELNNTVRIYLWYSLGMNSLLLFSSYYPTEALSTVMGVFGKTATELRAGKEHTLHSILTCVSELVEKELYRGKHE